MIKHIFSDLDGTLFNEIVTEKDAIAIKNAQDLGIRFSVATGRVHSHTLNITNNLDVNGYLICENGSYIYNPNGECIYKAVIADIQIKKVIELYRKLEYINQNDDIIYFKYDGRVIMPVMTFDSQYFKKGCEIDEGILDREHYDDLVGNIGIMSNDFEKLKKIVEDFKSILSSEFDIYISSPTTMNIVPKGVSKFDAIKKVCSIEGINTDEVVTIGDSPNDISMLKNIKMSFAMSNANDEVKSVAGYETPSVADAINMIIDFNDELQR